MYGSWVRVPTGSPQKTTAAQFAAVVFLIIHTPAPVLSTAKAQADT